MHDRLVGCASYTMSEFHVRNYMARRPHINQEPNVGTSTASIMYVGSSNVILVVKPLKNILSENLQPVFLRLLLTCIVGVLCIVQASAEVE